MEWSILLPPQSTIYLYSEHLTPYKHLFPRPCCTWNRICIRNRWDKVLLGVCEVLHTGLVHIRKVPDGGGSAFLLSQGGVVWKGSGTVGPAWHLPHRSPRQIYLRADCMWTKELENDFFSLSLSHFHEEGYACPRGTWPQFEEHCPAALSTEMITNCLVSICRTELSNGCALSFLLLHAGTRWRLTDAQLLRMSLWCSRR